jgi:hypothetical protein
MRRWRRTPGILTVTLCLAPEEQALWSSQCGTLEWKCVAMHSEEQRVLRDALRDYVREKLAPYAAERLPAHVDAAGTLTPDTSMYPAATSAAGR